MNGWLAFTRARLQHADYAVNKRLGDALVGQGLEQFGELSHAEAERHLIVLEQHVLQVAFTRGSLAADVVNNVLGFRSADLGCEGA